MRNFFKRLKSEKGATGTDVLISATMIVVTIGIVSMLYVNTSIQSRNITRTAGATRIATNLIENIDAMSYIDFVNQFGANTKLEYGANSENNVFNTKIPNGYSAVIEATPVYGSHTLPSEQFDLVRQVKITISYKVSNSDEKVEFSTVKQRELIEECNTPAVADLRNDVLEEGINFYPVKYLQNAKAYIRTTEDDQEWYNYTNKNWATVIVSRKAENTLFDVNGKLIASINTDKSSTNYTQKAVWIPKYFTKSSSSDVLFAFYSSQTQGISKSTLTSNNNSSSFLCNVATNIDSTWSAGNVVFNFGASDITGKWALLNSDNTFNSSDNFAKTLNNSQYGPCNMQ